MSRKPNPYLKVNINNGKLTNVYQSQRDAIKRYDEKQEKITVRMKRGSKEKIKKYIEDNSEWISNSGKLSMSAFINWLIDKEICD